jgi:hypothetical protein
VVSLRRVRRKSRNDTFGAIIILILLILIVFIDSSLDLLFAFFCKKNQQQIFL